MVKGVRAAIYTYLATVYITWALGRAPPGLSGLRVPMARPGFLYGL